MFLTGKKEITYLCKRLMLALKKKSKQKSKKHEDIKDEDEDDDLIKEEGVDKEALESLDVTVLPLYS